MVPFTGRPLFHNYHPGAHQLQTSLLVPVVWLARSRPRGALPLQYMIEDQNRLARANLQPVHRAIHTMNHSVDKTHIPFMLLHHCLRDLPRSLNHRHQINICQYLSQKHQMQIRCQFWMPTMLFDHRLIWGPHLASRGKNRAHLAVVMMIRPAWFVRNAGQAILCHSRRLRVSRVQGLNSNANSAVQVDVDHSCVRFCCGKVVPHRACLQFWSRYK